MSDCILLWRSARSGAIHAASRDNHGYTVCGQSAYEKDLEKMQGPSHLVTCKRCSKLLNVYGGVLIEEQRKE